MTILTAISALLIPAAAALVPDLAAGPDAPAVAALPAGGDQNPPAVTRYAGPAEPLGGRWTWAAAEAKRQGFSKGYWVGYSIEKAMGERSFIGSFYSDEKRNRPSLGELVTGLRTGDLPAPPQGEFGSMSGFVTYDDDGKPEKIVKKDVGILFHIDAPPSPVGNVAVSNLSLRVDLEGDPLLWLGAAGTDESVALLEERFREATATAAKKGLVTAVGIHDESARAVGFLKQVLTGAGDLDLRGDAAFWLGESGNDGARKALSEVAWKDASGDVREKCIFSLSRMEGEAALADLIALAKGHGDGDTRKHAAFWLGQKASEKAVGALREIAYGDEDTDVQRSAMFALAQAEEHSGSVNELIRIARTHPNPKIRRDAIFWLGQSEDPKAVDALVEMVKGR